MHSCNATLRSDAGDLACPLLPLPAGGSIGASRRPPAAAGRARAVLPLPVLPPLPLLPGARPHIHHQNH